MKKLLISLAIIAAFLVPAVIKAQEYNLADAIPFDPKVIIGKLNNGLTYYIRENKHPKDRAEFYLVVNAGSILEEDNQNGLAHFCEHMAFNGTKNFEKHEIINYLQSIGMKFGPEINAFTSHDVTNYMLQKVPTDIPENIDTALMILYDWANNVSFEDEEIDNERGVIHEEWRTRRGAQFRMMTKTDKVLYKGSKYAERDIIGDIEIIDQGSYEALRGFYNDWYRPDLQALIAVGDFDAGLIEQRIREMFSDIPKKENPKERTVYEVPDHNDTYIAIETDPEAQYVFVQLYYKHEPFEETTLSDYRQGILFSLYNQMLNNRLQEKLQQENPPFLYAYSAYTSMVRSKDAYIGFAVAKNDGIFRSLETLLTENERVKQHGFTESELERAKREFLGNNEKAFNEKDKQESSGYVWSYFSHFLENEPSPGIEFDYEFTKSIVPGIQLQELNKLAGEWITDKNRVVIITGPENENVEIPSESEIMQLINNIGNLETEAYDDNVSDLPLVPVKPEPGNIEKITKNKKLGTQEWLLSNGVKVILKPTDFKDDEILMRAFSFGGTSLYDAGNLPSAEFSTDVISESGLGSFDKIQLQKIMAGKIVNLYPYVNNISEGFRGNSSVKDFESLLQLVYLYFNYQRSDETAFRALMNRMEGFLENRKNNPASAFQDTISVTMANYHPRVQLFDLEYLNNIDFKKATAIFNERFEDPAGFTFYFVGNLNVDSIKPLIETWLGSLMPVKKNEQFNDHMIRPPKGIIEKVVAREMKVPKATVYVGFTGTFDYSNFLNRISLTALCDILDIRYTESIREEQGGTYGVGVYPTLNQYPWENYQVTIRFDCDPENVDKLKAIVYDEIEKLKNEGPAEKDLMNVKENKLKTRKENLENNEYWIGKLEAFGLNNESINDYLNYEKYVNKLTAKELKNAAKMFFDDNRVEIILLPVNIDENIKNPVMINKEG